MAVQTWIYGKPDVSYEGCVLDTYERNGSFDSDCYAICWDEERQKVVEVNYDTTRCGCGGRADIDATEDTLLKVYRFYKRQGRETFDSYTNERQAKEVKKGDTVLVIRGRKIPKGSVGKVFWIGTRYNRYSRTNEDRVGLEIDGVRQFLPLEYVEPVNWQERLLHGKERKRQIRNYAISSMPRHYRSLFMRAVA